MKSTALGAENIIFISDAHEKFYYEKLQEVRYQDVYHKALCYCLGINGDTRKNADRIYNFKTGSVKTKCLHEGWQTSGSLKVVENAIQSFLGLRYESDRKAGSTSCNLISVTKSWNWKGKNWWNRRNELPDLQREKDLWTKYGCTIQWFWEYRIIFNLPPASALIAGKSTDRS